MTKLIYIYIYICNNTKSKFFAINYSSFYHSAVYNLNYLQLGYVDQN
jgi:hypothetical protein